MISRTSVAGVLTSFKTLLLEGKSVTKSATETASEGLMKQAVKNNPAAIGFISNYQVEPVASTPSNVENVACTKAYVNTYPGVARFYEVTRGPAKGAALVHLVDRPLARRIEIIGRSG